jgi:hypothetical protein
MTFNSMDWLNFLRGIHKRLHVDIPEADYKSLADTGRCGRLRRKERTTSKAELNRLCAS